MAYCDIAALQDRYGATELRQLAPAGIDGTDVGRVERACQDASDIADGYLRTRYVLPLAEVPPLLARLVAAIARHELHLGEGRQPTDQVTKERDAAVAALRDIAAGKADLGLPDGQAPAEDGGTVLRIPSAPRTAEEEFGAYRYGWLG
jgi:phage gp36-like protein